MVNSMENIDTDARGYRIKEFVDSKKVQVTYHQKILAKYPLYIIWN